MPWNLMINPPCLRCISKRDRYSLKLSIDLRVIIEARIASTDARRKGNFFFFSWNER